MIVFRATNHLLFVSLSAESNSDTTRLPLYKDLHGEFTIINRAGLLT